MIYFISSRDHIGSSIHRRQVLLKLHCLTRSLASMPPTSPSHLQLVQGAKSCLDLLHLDHKTQCHVSCVMSSFIITCVSFATTSSHFHRHGCHTHFKGTNGMYNIMCAQRSITHKMTNINSIITNVYYITNNITESSRN
jgi:hypothetical protein